jgi:glycosyltransferase involved in cell wall biosynthesis
MSIASLITVCIPTFNRTDLLLQAVESCLKQTYQDIEIVISDDSDNDHTEQAVHRLNRPDVIRYHRNKPSLGQNANVNRLFGLARGERLVLLHDDDLLLPDALEQMDACWQKNPFIVACFGKQYLISMEGEMLQKESEGLNRHYRRTPEMAGLQTSAVWSAMVAQFPNNAYLVLTEAARRVGYRTREEVGDACDYDFGIRLALWYGNFWFLDEYTAAYRLSEVSVTKGASFDGPYHVFHILKDLRVPEFLEPTRQAGIKDLSPFALNNMLQKGMKREAQKLYFSGDYPLLKKISARGLWHMFQVVCPEPIERRITLILRKARLAA